MAQMTAAAINDLPDSAFAYIESGGTKDEDGKTTPRSKRHFPIHDAAHVRNALARAPQSPYGDKAMPKIKAVAKKFGIEVSDDAGRSAPAQPEVYQRDWALEDIEILSRAKGGDGRTVDAYAAVFNIEQEVHDKHGDYREKIHPSAFNRTLSHGIQRVGVFYHHGMTLHGTPSDLGSVPVARPLDITADGRGLRTVSRYNKSALADSVLESIKNGDIRGYSFRGGIYRSDPPSVPRTRRGSALPLMNRLELGLKEYGPTPTPYYEDAAITAVRAADTLASLPADERRELIRILSAATPHTVPAASATPDGSGLGAEDPHDVHSVRLRSLQLALGKALNGVT